MQGLTTLAPFVGILSLIIAWLIYNYVKKQPNGNPLMADLEEQIHTGAMTFLKREYTVLIVFIGIVFILLGWGIAWKTAICFITGAFASMLAGFSGMTAATRGNSRTAEAANKHGQPEALNVSYFSGSVMGLAVAGLGLLGLGIWFWIYGGDPATAEYINGFAMGASSIALFARVGGGVYTKAADVGADLVGKVEAGIPEDDPRNPGVIADNVGDNVGDIAGMGADIFESFVGSVNQNLSERRTGRRATVHHFCGRYHIHHFHHHHYQILRHAFRCFLGHLIRSALRHRHRSYGGILHLRTSGQTRKITDGLDALGNTTAAIGKGFAIGSAALTALALFVAYSQAAHLGDVLLDNPKVIIGLFIGGMVPMTCAALTMTSVGKAAYSIVEEIRRQFREIPGLLEGKEGVRGDSSTCVSIATNSALKEMVKPGLIAVLTPVAVGFLLGKETLAGVLIGATVMGAFLALQIDVGGVIGDCSHASGGFFDLRLRET